MLLRFEREKKLSAKLNGTRQQETLKTYSSLTQVSNSSELIKTTRGMWIHNTWKHAFTKNVEVIGGYKSPHNSDTKDLGCPVIDFRAPLAGREQRRDGTPSRVINLTKLTASKRSAVQHNYFTFPILSDITSQSKTFPDFEATS